MVGYWIPAFAGMTVRSDNRIGVDSIIPASAGMTVMDDRRGRMPRSTLRDGGAGFLTGGGFRGDGTADAGAAIPAKPVPLKAGIGNARRPDGDSFATK